MAVERGRDVLIYIDTDDAAAGATGTWVALGQQRGGGLGRAIDTADGTYKETGSQPNVGWARAIATRKNWSVSCDGALNPADSAWQHLLTRWNNMQDIHVQIDASGITSGEKVDGKAWITDLSYEFPENDVVTFTAELQGDGQLKTSV